MKNSLLAIFDKLWSMTLYYIVQGLWPNFLSNIKKFIKNPISIRIYSKFLHNIRMCICIRKNYKNGTFSPSHFKQILVNDPVL